MKSNYRRIGDHIRVVDERNSDLKIENLLGLSITKEFVPSVANTIGTDMSRYKVIKKNQFVCSTMQVRRDKKMPVALLKHVDKGIISPAYYVFEVVDENILLPDYLMMWFSRTEFDREACFYAIGGVRGSLEWEDFCDMKLPVPSIEKQREIVKEYNIVLDRIKSKQDIINILENISYTIFKKYFFEHKLIKQSRYNEFENIPPNWEVQSLADIAKYLNGLSMQNYRSNKKNNILPVLKIRELRNGMTDADSDKCTSEISKEYKIHNGDIIFSWSGSLLVDIWCGGDCGLNQHLFKITSNKYEKWFYYLWTKYHLDEFKKIAEGKATTMGHIKREDLKNALVLVPSQNELKIMDSIFMKLINCLIIYKIEGSRLIKFKNILLRKLTIE